MYRTSCVSNEDIGIKFIPDYQNKVEHSHTFTLKECIDTYCDTVGIDVKKYYFECEMLKEHNNRKYN